MKRKISALLLLTMLASLAACGREETPAQDTTEGVGTANPGNETVSLAEQYGIVKADFGNEEVCIITGEHVEYEFMCDESSGDIVENAIYKRNLNVEELLNVDFSFVSAPNWTQAGEFYSLILSDVLAGDSTYDIVNGLNVFTTPMIFEGVFARLDTIDTIDFSHPWWVPGQALDGSGEVYMAFSDASLSLYKDLYVIFFNQSIIEENKMESPYELVENNNWTMDSFLKLAAEGSRDVNGDEAITEDTDQLAFLAKHAAMRSFMTASELSLIGTDANGEPQFLSLNDRMVNVFEKYKNFLTNKSLAFISMEADMIQLSQPFVDGRVLFLNNCLIAVEGMRNMTDDYGIVPMPKYDESQESYHTQIATSTSAFYMPVTVEDPDMIGTVMEALGFYSYTEVVPTYYDTALSVKYARDEQVQQMLALVRQSASTSIDFLYSAIFNTNDLIDTAWRGKELASWHASMETAITAKLYEYLDIDIDG